MMIHDGDMVRLLWLEQCHQSDYRKVEVEGVSAAWVIIQFCSLSIEAQSECSSILHVQA